MPAAVVVDDHEGAVEPLEVGGEQQTVGVVQQGEVADQGDGRASVGTVAGGVGDGDAERRGDDPVDPGRAAVGHDAHALARAQHLVEVPDRHRGTDDQRGAVGQVRRQVARESGLGERVAVVQHRGEGARRGRVRVVPPRCPLRRGGDRQPVRECRTRRGDVGDEEVADGPLGVVPAHRRGRRAPAGRRDPSDRGEVARQPGPADADHQVRPVRPGEPGVAEQVVRVREGAGQPRVRRGFGDDRVARRPGPGRGSGRRGRRPRAGGGPDDDQAPLGREDAVRRARRGPRRSGGVVPR